MCLGFPLKAATIFSEGMSAATLLHVPKTVAALTNLSESEWCIFDMVSPSPPQEKALFTLVDGAESLLSCILVD